MIGPKLSRRVLLAGGAAAGAMVAAPFALGGAEGFLRRAAAAHFGDDVLKIEGIEDFIRDYAKSAGDGDGLKRLAGEYYFGLRIDAIHKTGAIKAFEERFLFSLLSRSNIIAMMQNGAEEFDYQNPDPWDPQCGLYLSALAEDT